MFQRSKTLVAMMFSLILITGIIGIARTSANSNRVSAAVNASFTDDMPKVELKEGMVAPDFTLLTDGGKQVKLSDYRGKQRVVLYFYPKDETPGCTKQACAFRDSLADYRKEKIEVLGVSVDTVEAHKAFKKNQRLNFTLLADADKKVSANTVC